LKAEKIYDDYNELYAIVTRLRSPGGCPWDRKQTLNDMKNYLLEESYETVTAIQDNDMPAVREEIGDVFLILAMMVRILTESGNGSPEDIFAGICAKLIRRHPHVFGDEELHDAASVKRKWDEIKETVEGRKKKIGVHAVPAGLPPLERSLKIQKRAAKTGFDWEDHAGPFDKLHEEIDELRTAVDSGTAADTEGEIGDILFSAVNLARKLNVDPMAALHRTNEKFLRRYGEVERSMSEAGESMEAGKLDLMDKYWNRAKEQERPD
jgi:nucleoside triphosphate diphosphatase